MTVLLDKKETDTIESRLPAEHPANWLLMLDVDGTLLDIAHRPDAVAVPLYLKEALLKLYDLLSGAVILVSGRSIAELDILFAPLKLPCVGLHGGEYRIAGRAYRHRIPGIEAQLKHLADDCRRAARQFPGVIVESKPLSVAVHYRLMPEAGPEICSWLEKTAAESGPDWMVLHGKMVCEIKPSFFHKLSIVQKIRRMKRFAERKPVYVGDDITDEAALQAIHEQHGYAIRVGNGGNETGMIPVETPDQLRRWLVTLAQYSNAHSVSQPLRRHDPGRSLQLVSQMRLIMVSNRVLASQAQSSGGLAVAMNDLLKLHGGAWAGWNGKIAEAAPVQKLQRGNITYLLQSLTQEEYDKFYMRFCNGTLWPILHYNIGLSEFDRSAYEAYLEVNRRYAELLAPMLTPEDYIWVHDFHFIPLANFLRRLGVTNRIGFFLHTPFPAREVLLTLPVHKELLSNLYAYDLAGFQTQHDVSAFHDYSASENIRAIAECARPETSFKHFPISIPTGQLARMSRKALKSKEAQDLEASLNGRKLILGVDRLDYSKGIIQRLKAVEDLLSRNGRWRQQFTFLQISPPTREGLAQFEQLRVEVESLVGRINGMYTDIDWVPIRFLARSFNRNSLAAFYRMARICLVTPLRDGMNLVAKEFIAAQDPEDPGVLVLSRFAGAAEELQQALLVNPYDIPETANAIEQALQMPLDERRQRWKAMFDTISRQTLEKWYQDFLASLVGY